MTEESSFLNPSYALANAGIREGQAVADFNAGGGFFTRAAARAVGDGTVWAEGLHNVEVLRANIEAKAGSGLPSGHFDAVIAANILFSAHDKTAVVKEIYRVLKKAGRAVVIDWTSSHGGLGPHPEQVVSEAEARDLFEQNGFSYLEKIPAGAYHWGFTVRKKAGKDAQ
jgi:ubiquinone/menaquinone biosynthesis C-methylase UbiE